MKVAWSLQSCFYWITNMHWEGNDPKKHWFCYKEHWIASEFVAEGKKITMMLDTKI